MTPRQLIDLLLNLFWHTLRKIIAWPFIMLQTRISLIKGLPFLVAPMATPFFFEAQIDSLPLTLLFFAAHLITIVVGVLWIHDDVKRNPDPLNPWHSRNYHLTFGAKKPLERLASKYKAHEN